MLDNQNVIVLDTDITAKIDGEVEKILDSDGFELPDAKSELVRDYVKKIEGTYSVEGAKEDTDNAVHLLTIAYRTTPVEEGGIRNRIDEIRNRLVKLQQASQLRMEEALLITAPLQKEIADVFFDWKTARLDPASEDFIEILTEDVNNLAGDMAKQARKIQKKLIGIADEYDDVIKKMEDIIATAQLSLADRVKYRTELQDEIFQHQAKRAELKRQADELQDVIEKFDQRAKQYEKQAQSAEQRAFVTSLIQVGAQMISSSVPAIAAAVTGALTGAATGGASIVASNAMSSLRQLTDFSGAEIEDDDTADALKTRREIADKNTERTVAENNAKRLMKKLESLRADMERLESAEGTDNSTKIKALEKRISKTEEELSEEQTKSANAAVAVESLQSVLGGLDENMGRLSQEQQQQAGALRQMQTKMMDKVEEYLTQKRDLESEMADVTALLKRERSEEETLELAIKSLAMCLEALKRAKEIIVELAAFFHNFAAYIGNTAVDADAEAEKIQAATETDPPKARYLRRVARRTDNFFVTQAAQWHAVSDVSARFVETFEHGWTRLSKLSGEYLYGDALTTYLAGAGDEIDEIVAARRERANARIHELEKYRARLDAVAGEG